MLDRSKLIRQITTNASRITIVKDDQVALAVKTWNVILCDSNFQTNLLNASLPWSVPSWQGDLGQITQFQTPRVDYTVVASDGSQIYPDRHMGNNCYLINTGVVTLVYGDKSRASFDSEPYFFTNVNRFEGSVADYIDSKRHELEIADGLKTVLAMPQADSLLYLADGSLIAWHLFGKGAELCEQFLPVYFEQLQHFYAQRMPFVGYISLPNSKELVGLLRAQLCNFVSSAAEANLLETVVDADFLSQILPPFQMTTWFKSGVAAAQAYPENLKPYFAYLNTGNEIARIEVPAWIVHDTVLLQHCMQIVVDQVHKGYGYPVCLAEAHQQAVIKAPDRTFFYHAINQITNQKNGGTTLSRKLRQKQVMGF